MAIKPYRVCLLGASLDNPNRGVNALAASFFTLMRKVRPDSEFYSLYGNRTGGQGSMQCAGQTVPITIVNYRQSLRCAPREHIAWILLMALAYRILPFKAVRRAICRWTPWIDALDRADFIGEIRGGDSFSDLYGLKKFILGTLPTITPILMGKPLVLLPQTFIPFRSRVARGCARWIMRHSQRIFARDRLSLETARQMLGDQAEKAQFCPDVAFALEPHEPSSLPIVPPLTEAHPLVGININGMLYCEAENQSSFGIRGSYREFIGLLLEAILKDCKAEVLLVPHVFSGGQQDDLAPCRELMSQIPEEHSGRVHLIYAALDPNELKALIGRCDLFVGSRMHSCIAALSQGIPCLGVAYSRKFVGVFSTVEAGQWVLDASEMPPADLVASIVNHLEKAGKDQLLLGRVEAARQALEAVFSGMVGNRSEAAETIRALTAE